MGIEQKNYEPRLFSENVIPPKGKEEVHRELYNGVYAKVIRVVDDAHLTAPQKSELLAEMIVNQIEYFTGTWNSVLND